MKPALETTMICHFCNCSIENESGYLIAMLKKPINKSFGMTGKFITETTTYKIDSYKIPSCEVCKKQFLFGYRLTYVLVILVSLIGAVGLVFISGSLFTDTNTAPFIFWLVTTMILGVAVAKCGFSIFYNKNPKNKVHELPELNAYYKAGYQHKKFI